MPSAEAYSVQPYHDLPGIESTTVLSDRQKVRSTIYWNKSELEKRTSNHITILVFQCHKHNVQPVVHNHKVIPSFDLPEISYWQVYARCIVARNRNRHRLWYLGFFDKQPYLLAVASRWNPVNRLIFIE